jgi:hypothetical protein
MLTTLLLTAHLLVGVALLGAITHQSVGLLRLFPLGAMVLCAFLLRQFF